jgi:hypothetical protein
MRLVAAIAVSVFVRSVTMRTRSLVVTSFAECAQAAIQQVLLIRSMRIVTRRTFTTDSRSMWYRHRQLRFHVLMTRKAQIRLSGCERDTSGARMAGVARPV